jgi:hypothetical protein
MTKPNFADMTKAELKAYVIEHRDDSEAFYALMDKLNSEPGIKIRSLEHLAQIIEEKQKAKGERLERLATSLIAGATISIIAGVILLLLRQ